MNNKSILSAALMLAALQLSTQNAQAEEKAKTDAKADPKGKCYGVVGKGEGECGGKNPATGETWTCHGGNPTADLGWKKMTKSECEKTAKHKDAKEKKFVAN